MRKILFIECCGEDNIYFDKRYRSAGYCKHSEGNIEEIDAFAMPLWCPLQDADTVEGG